MKEFYLEICKKHLPHLLSMYDLDPFSKTRGYGDREFWGWKSRDYCNASFQGGVLTLAAMVKLGQFQGHENKIVEIIKSIIEATSRIKYKNHSVDEIMPYENSFCVAASLVVDILYAIDFLGDFLSPIEKKRYFKLCKDFIHFYANNVESHGIISNHLAAGVAGIVKYQKMTGDDSFNDKGEQILETIYKHQSNEGWYREYEGVDPGYQTLCTYYLAIVYQLTKDPRLLDSITKSLEFISYFIHPDGSIGGEYGSRNTQIYYPAGFEILKGESEIAAVISDYIIAAIENQQTVSLDEVDIGNFVPFINNYIIAYFESVSNEKDGRYQLPFYNMSFNKYFDESGLFIVNRPTYYAIVGIKKGGVLKIFDKNQKKLVLDDCGYFGELSNGKRISTQIFNEKTKQEVNESKVQIIQPLYAVLENYPTPIKFIILRIMNVSIMRIHWINKYLKQLLVKMLITNKMKFNILLNRDCLFYDNKIVIIDKIINRTSYYFKWLDYGQKFSTIHMASSKYYNKHYLLKNVMYSKLDIRCLNSRNEITVNNEISI